MSTGTQAVGSLSARRAFDRPYGAASLKPPCLGSREYWAYKDLRNCQGRNAKTLRLLAAETWRALPHA